jgi:hypothetical protein
MGAKMRSLRGMSPREVQAEAEALRERRRAADLEAAPLFSTMLTERDAEDDDDKHISPDDLP